MKKIIFSALFVATAVTTSYGQGFSFGFNAGYGLPLAQRELDVNSTSTSGMTGTQYTYEQVSGSFGSGLTFGGHLGFMFSENFGLELGADYLIGSKYKSTSSSTSIGFSSNGETVYQGKMLNLAPKFVLRAGSGTLTPYAKIGLNIGVLGCVTIEDNYSNSLGDSDLMEMKFNKGVAFGVVSEGGLRLNLGERLSLDFGLRVNSMNWAPKHGEITKYESNGVDQLSTLTTYQREVDFVDKLTEDTGNPPNDNNPDQQLKTFLPFSSYGLNIGIAINL